MLPSKAPRLLEKAAKLTDMFSSPGFALSYFIRTKDQIVLPVLLTLEDSVTLGLPWLRADPDSEDDSVLGKKRSSPGAYQGRGEGVTEDQAIQWSSDVTCCPQTAIKVQAFMFVKLMTS